MVAVDLTPQQTRENIDRYCEKFEKDMLYLFDRCYRKGDPKLMHVGPVVVPLTTDSL